MSTPDDPRPDLDALSRDDCLVLLATQTVGRLAVIDDEGMPMVVPVNFQLVGDRVVFRTAPGEKVVGLQRHPVAFQIDAHDPIHRTGWSVLVRGVAHEMSEAERAGIEVEPWASGAKDVWIQIVPRHITGRRLVDHLPFEPPGGYL